MINPKGTTMKRLLLTTMIAAAAVSLTGCTSGAPEPHEKVAESTPKATITSTPVPGYTPPTGTCDDGTATIIADVEEIALPDGCANVRIVSSASTITLGPVEHLQIEGNDNSVTVASVDEIAVFGDRNDIGHGGEPTVDDEGAENTIAAK